MIGRAGSFFLALLVLAAPLPVAAALPELFDVPLHSAAFVRPKYPVVFVHGIFAREARGPYFRGVEERMRELGVPASFPRLGFANGVAERADRLAAHLDATWAAGKVNVVAHSIGGLATRDLIVRMGFTGRVASLTTISTPHRGTPVADWVIRHFGDSTVLELAEMAGIRADALRDLTTAACAAFNARTPDAPGVAYFALGGAQSWWHIRAPLQPFCWLIRLESRVRAGRRIDAATRERLARESYGPALLAHLDRTAREVAQSGANAADLAAWQAVQGANDGVVPLTSTPWGTALGAVDMDHLDQIGWGTDGTESADFYESLVRRLAAQGF